MEVNAEVRAAEMAWTAMRQRGIPPTPRNFEVWFAYCVQDKPRLRQRMDRLIEAGETFTPGIMDALFQDFFAYPIGTMASDSRELRQIAVQLADRITADRAVLSDYGAILNGWGPAFDAVLREHAADRPTTILKVATREAGNRMAALEQLVTASLIRISELHEKLLQSEKEAACDPLTGLANRRAFDQALRVATGLAASQGYNVALLLLDIDHFKHFNDVHGHIMGDNVLRLVAQVLLNHIKGRDTAARYGGEEFAVILVDAGMAAATTVAEQIRLLLEKRPVLNRSTGENLGVITCSIGVAVHQPDEPLGNLIERADRALYGAKHAGRNRVLVDETAVA